MKQIFTLLLSILSLTTFAQNWDEVIKAVASDRAAGDEFGYSVCIDGDRAIVGASLGDKDALGGNTLFSAGAAYIFELNGGVWTEVAKLVASDRNNGDRFGGRVSISGDKAIISAFAEDDDALGGNALSNSGSAYIFELTGGVWSETAKLVASDRDTGDQFGVNVSISGDKVIVGAFLEDEDASGGNTQSSAGAAYIFELSGGVWTETAKLVASDRATNDQFGVRVRISANRVIVGARFEDEDMLGGNTVSDAGSVYVFELSGGVWSETAKLVATDRGADDNFGISIGISGDKVIVGAYQEDEDALGGNTQSNAGAAYIFELSGGIWTETAKLVASDRATDDQFGVSVSISGDKAIVGSPFEDEDAIGGSTLESAGAAYIFELNGGVWTETVKLVASDRADDTRFGLDVSIDDNRVIVGAPYEDQDVIGGNLQVDAGSVYMFELSGGVGVDDLELSTDNLMLYPNPAKSILTIDTEEKIKKNIILDIMGKTVKTIVLPNSTISVSDLTEGIYFLQIQTNKGLVSKKFIKE